LKTPASAGVQPWNGSERHGENRARSVVRPNFAAHLAAPSMAARATGTDGAWSSF